MNYEEETLVSIANIQIYDLDDFAELMRPFGPMELLLGCNPKDIDMNLLIKALYPNPDDCPYLGEPTKEQAIVCAVAEHYRMTEHDIKGKKRDQSTVLARHVAMYLLKKILKYGPTQIAVELNSGDHSTVIYGLDDIQQKLESGNVALRDDIEKITHRAKGHKAFLDENICQEDVTEVEPEKPEMLGLPKNIPSPDVIAAVKEVYGRSKLTDGQFTASAQTQGGKTLHDMAAYCLWLFGESNLTNVTIGKLTGLHPMAARLAILDCGKLISGFPMHPQKLCFDKVKEMLGPK